MLAGGASSRMGSDKARLPLDGWPTAVRLCERLEAAGLQAALVRRAPDGLPWMHPDGREVTVVREGDGPRHPLRGVLTALEHAGEPALIVPCDLPALTVHTLAALAARGPCVAAGHPLVGVFPHDLERLRALVASDAPARAFGDGLPTVDLPPDELFDRNTPPDVLPLVRMLGRLEGIRGLDPRAALSGEITRMRARGVVVPEAVLYALPRVEVDQ